jgi:uncharacterized protein YkwD
MRGKKNLALLLAVILSLFAAEPAVVSAATQSISIQVTYGQSEARSMLDDINSFRTSDTQAWAYNESGKKVKYSGLGELTYDYELERVAMKRAAEIAVSYGHTRPNGESCFTAYEYKGGAIGENISAGYVGTAGYTADDVFVAWREDNADYNGQGHRRNMLSKYYNAIGIGHVIYQGVDYWVQEFSSDITDTTDPGANDSGTTVSVGVDSSYIQKLKAVQSSISLKAGETLDLSGVDVKLTVSGYWGIEKTCAAKVSCTASVADSSIATYSNHALTGVKAGSTTVTLSACGKQVTLPLTVSGTDASSSGTTASEPTSAQLKASVALKAASKTLKKGKTCRITFTDKLESAYVSKITYTSSNTKVATVSKAGKVTAKKKGSAVIKCKVKFNEGTSKTVNFKVKVK